MSESQFQNTEFDTIASDLISVYIKMIDHILEIAIFYRQDASYKICEIFKFWKFLIFTHVLWALIGSKMLPLSAHNINFYEKQNKKPYQSEYVFIKGFEVA